MQAKYYFFSFIKGFLLTASMLAFSSFCFSGGGDDVMILVNQIKVSLDGCYKTCANYEIQKDIVGFSHNIVHLLEWEMKNHMGFSMWEDLLEDAIHLLKIDSANEIIAMTNKEGGVVAFDERSMMMIFVAGLMANAIHGVSEHDKTGHEISGRVHLNEQLIAISEKNIALLLSVSVNLVMENIFKRGSVINHLERVLNDSPVLSKYECNPSKYIHDHKKKMAPFQDSEQDVVLKLYSLMVAVRSVRGVPVKGLQDFNRELGFREAFVNFSEMEKADLIRVVDGRKYINLAIIKQLFQKAMHDNGCSKERCSDESLLGVFKESLLEPEVGSLSSLENSVFFDGDTPYVSIEVFLVYSVIATRLDATHRRKLRLLALEVLSLFIPDAEEVERQKSASLYRIYYMEFNYYFDLLDNYIINSKQKMRMLKMPLKRKALELDEMAFEEIDGLSVHSISFMLYYLDRLLSIKPSLFVEYSNIPDMVDVSEPMDIQPLPEIRRSHKFSGLQHLLMPCVFKTVTAH